MGVSHFRVIKQFSSSFPCECIVRSDIQYAGVQGNPKLHVVSKRALRVSLVWELCSVYLSSIKNKESTYGEYGYVHAMRH